MKYRTLAAATGLLLLGASPLASLHAQAAAPNDSVKVEAHLIRQRISSNILEARLGEVGQRKATNKMVQGFAQQMATDHRRLGKLWVDLGIKHGLTVSDTLGPKGQEQVKHMEGLGRSSFDKEYMTAMIKAHARDADQLKTSVDSVSAEPVKKLLGYERPIVLDHLKGAVAAGKEVGVDTMVVNESKKIAAGE
jgi:putative membrane protein